MGAIRHLSWIIAWLYLASPLFAANMYVRPYDAAGYGASDGSTYAAAFNGLDDVVWGAEAGQVGPGDTLYVCGTHPSTGSGTSVYAHTSLVVGASGTAESRIVIDGDCPDEVPNGQIWRAAFRIPAGSVWTDSETNSVYWIEHINNATDCFENTTYMGGEVAVCTDYNTYSAGDWCKDDVANKLYVKSTAGTPTDYTYTTLSAALNIDIVSYDYVTVKNLTLYGGTSSGTVRVSGSDSIILDALTIKYSDRAVSVYGDSNDGQFINSTISDAGEGFYTTWNSLDIADRWIIHDNTISNIQDFDNHAGPDNHAIAFQGGTGHLVYDNTISVAATGITMYCGSAEGQDGSVTAYRNSVSGIVQVDGGHGYALDIHSVKSRNCTGEYYSNKVDASYGCIRASNTGADTKFYNNTCGNIANVGIQYYSDMDSTRTGDSIYVKNNIFEWGTWDAGDYFIYVANSWPAVQIFHADYNQFYPDIGTGNTVYYVHEGAGGASTWANYLTAVRADHDIANHTNCLTSNPLFVGASDFHLQGASPAKAAGINLGTGFTDFAGVNLPSAYGWPIGAYSYNSFGGGTGSFSGSIQ